METHRRLLVTHTFGGPRFERAGLELSVLSELIAYRHLVVECAKELWRRGHPDRERLPANYEDGIVLSFSNIERGSVVVPIERTPVSGEQASLFDELDEVDKAVALIADVVDAANNDRPLPSEFPVQVLPMFDQYGKTLRGDEWTELKPAGRLTGARYTEATRIRLSEWASNRWEDHVDLIGTVTMTRVIPPRFELQVGLDGLRVEAPFEPSAEETILAGLTAHETAKVRVVGTGEFTDAGLRRIVSVVDIQLLLAGELPIVRDRPRIWETVREIMDAVPDDEWANVPQSDDVDRALYGLHGS